MGVLIETLWNVNKADPYKYSLADSVLIETLWNVNKRVKRIRRIRKIVLIETLWNVNFEMLQYLLRLPVY